MCETGLQSYTGSQAPWIYKMLFNRRLDSMKLKIKARLNPNPLSKAFVEKEIIKNSVK